MSDTPRTDALTFEIEARRKLRGFNMPEDLADALNLSDKIEQENAKMQAALPLLRRVIETIDNWNADPFKRVDHPFTALAKYAREALEPPNA